MEKSLQNIIKNKYDSLTGVYERFTIEDFARDLIKLNHPFSLILIDGDNFKNVNDGYGHKVGDVVITIIAQKLKEAFENIGFVGRFGGDEFIVVLPDVVEYDDVWKACRNTFDKFEKFTVPSYPAISVTITIGLSRFPKDGTTYEELFEKADKALYRGKQKGRACFIIYLDEKHKDIKIQSSLSPIANSMQMHNTIFNMFSKSKNLKDSISYLLEFFTTTLMIDHVGIQGKKELLFFEVYSLSRGKNFSFIDNSMISLNINKTTSIFNLGDIKQLLPIHQNELVRKFEEQMICSTFYAEISYSDIFYGYLRADTTTTLRIWQNNDMDLLLTAAKVIGMMLFYEGKKLEDLK